jgi:hypothetical protein
VIDVEMPDTLASAEAWTEPKGWPTPPRPFHEGWRDLDFDAPPVLHEIVEAGRVTNAMCAEEPVLREGAAQVRDRLAQWRYQLAQLIELPATRTTPGGEVVEDAQHQAAIQQAQRQIAVALQDVATIRERLELIEQLRQERLGADSRPPRRQPDPLAALALAAQAGDEAARQEFTRLDTERRHQAELERLAAFERERLEAERREQEAIAGRAEAERRLAEIHREIHQAGVAFEDALQAVGLAVKRLVISAASQHEVGGVPPIDPTVVHRAVSDRVIGTVVAAAGPATLLGFPMVAPGDTTPLPARLGLPEPTRTPSRRRGDR